MRKKHYGLLLMGATLLGGCSSEPEWVEVYERCKASVEAQSEQMKSVGAESNDEQVKAMSESMGNMAIGMAMSACEMIRTSCEEDEDGPACRAYVEQGRQK